MNSPSVIRCALACVLLGAAHPDPAWGEPARTPPVESGDARPRPSLREIWVPAEDLAPALGRYPRAVSLSHDQLFNLLRDAHASEAVSANFENPPPVRAAIRQARFEGWLAPGPGGKTQVRVEGQVEIEALSDAWTEVPLGLQGIALGTAEIDDAASPSHAPGTTGLRRVGGGTGGSASVEIQGRGVHRLRVGFILSVQTGSEGSSIALPMLNGTGEFLLHLPAVARADSPGGCAVQADAAGIVARVALRQGGNGPVVSSTAIRDFAKPDRASTHNPPSAEPDRLNWRTPPPASTETGALLQTGRTEAMVGESGVTIRQEIRLRAAFGRLSGELRFALPVGASAIRVEGAFLGQWGLGADGLHVAVIRDSESDGTAVFTVDYILALTPAPGGGMHFDLPMLEAVGAHRVAGEVALKRSTGITVQRIAPGPAAVPAATGIFSHTEETAPDFVAGFAVVDLPGAGNVSPLVALQVDARRNTTRYSVDADVRADFQLDGVHIARTLTFHVEEGEMFAAHVKLTAGETVLALHATNGSKEPDWRQEGGELLLRWTAGLPESSETVLAIESRAELIAPKPGTPSEFSLGAALVPGAERLTGYIALASTPAFRLTTTGGEDRLERRDGRITPVRGDVAWFYRDDFRLALRVERRTAETEARFTGDVLPLTGAVEIHAQIAYRFLYSGVESVQVRVPREWADAFFFTGDHIAERRRDDDVWTIRFQGERNGDYTLGVQATIPAPSDKDDAQRFHFRLPAIVPLESVHWTGTWAVEANTDTEIRFAASGANEVDTLNAPPLAGYQPRRRVIGMFEFLGGTANTAIDLDGVRHPPAGGAVAVVDRLDLETDASTSGVMRHRATVRARTVGDGFFNLHLPQGAALWSLTLDGEPVKPVRGVGAMEEVRVELPGGRNPANANKIVVIYETPGQAWNGAGWRSAVAPRFDDGVPVLRSHWTLSVPDGYEYRFAETPLDKNSPNPTSGDLLVPRMATAFGHMAQWVYYYPWFGQEMHMLALPRWMAAEIRKRNDRQAGVESSMTMDLAEPMVVAEQAAELKDADATRELVAAATPTPTDEITPKHIARVQPVKKYLLEAQQYYDTGRFDLAIKRYEQVLALDPYNDAARRGEERVDLARRQSGDKKGYSQTRGRAFALSAAGSDSPILDSAADTDPRRNYQKINDNSGTVAITRKLQNIIIPNIEYRQTTLNDAVEFLRQEARRLDTQTPEEERGINIFLKLAASPPSTSNAPIPGLPPGAETAPQTSPSAMATGQTRITLTLSNIPLRDALDYTAKAVNLKVKVEPYAVSLVPLTEETGDMVTVEIRIPPSFIGTTSVDGATGTTDVTGTSSGALTKREDAKTFLESSGVTFPPGSSAVYLASTNKLVVRNTQANIDLVTALTSESAVLPPCPRYR